MSDKDLNENNFNIYFEKENFADNSVDNDSFVKYEVLDEVSLALAFEASSLLVIIS